MTPHYYENKSNKTKQNKTQLSYLLCLSLSPTKPPLSFSHKFKPSHWLGSFHFSILGIGILWIGS